MITQTTNTAEILAEMLTENTGRHLLDSGDYYGRHYERNAGLTARDFLARPRVINEGDYFISDVFHFLNDRLEFAPVIDAAFQTYYDASDDYALGIMEEFPQTLGATDVETYNTYNYEEALSQTLQFTTFNLGDETFAALQIHGGADVRGGYTRPRVFRIVADNYALLDFSRVYVSCDNCGFYAYYFGSRPEETSCGYQCREGCGNVENIIPDDNPPKYGQQWRPANGCPCCGGNLG